jgi:hypothetical protein
MPTLSEAGRRTLAAEFPDAEKDMRAREVAAVWRAFTPGRSYLVGMACYREVTQGSPWLSFEGNGLPVARGGFTGTGRNDGIPWVDETIGLLRAACHRAFGEGHGTKFYNVFNDLLIKPWGLVLDKTPQPEKVEKEQQT